MSKSKRAKVVHLTKVGKKSRSEKEKLVEQIRSCAAIYSRIYLFQVKNMRNSIFKNLRAATHDSRYFWGKNKIISLALGTTLESECITGGASLGTALKGDVGLLFTNKTIGELATTFDSIQALDYARTGNPAELTVIIEADPMGLHHSETGKLLSTTIEPQLRQAGMPTKIHGGVILLTTPQYTICEAGKPLTFNQARLLKWMGIKMASFSICILGQLFDGKFENYSMDTCGGNDPQGKMEIGA